MTERATTTGEGPAEVDESPAFSFREALREAGATEPPSVRAREPVNQGESEIQNRQLLEIIPAAIYTCDRKGRLTFFNRAAAALWGREPELGKEMWCGSWQIYRPDGSPLPLDGCPMAVVLREGRPVVGEEIVVERPDGDRRHVLPHPKPLFNSSGELVGAVNLLVDITDRKRAEQALRESESETEVLLAAVRDDLALQVAGLTRLHELSVGLAAIPDLPTALHAILRAIADLHGTDRGMLSLYEESTGSLRVRTSLGFDVHALECVSGIIPGSERNMCATCFHTRERVVIEDIETDERFAEFRAWSRALKFRAIHSTPIVTRSGDILGALTVYFAVARRPNPREIQFADMCARKAANAIDAARTAEALRESERKIRGILDSSLQFMGLLDTDGRVLEANSTSLAFIGQSREEVIGRRYWETKWWSHSAELQESVQDAVERAAAGETIRMEGRLRALDRRWVDFEFSFKPIRDGNGSIVRILPEARDITDRKAAEMALNSAKESAEAANRSKDRFLAVLSHELRTPLTPVLMTVAAMEVDPALPGAVRSEIGMIRRNVELETKLIDDLLDLSRIASGKLPLQLQPVDLNGVVREVCAICRAQIVEKDIHLHLELDSGAGQVRADPARLQQLLWNVLKNAAKFTPANGSIHVNTSVGENAMILVTIRDTGIGIEPESMPRLFNAFEQGSERTTREFGGLGLGLAISKALVDHHHGFIRAASEGTGKGSTFTIGLPSAGFGTEEVQMEARGLDKEPATQLRLLVVEDHRDTAKALARLLRATGYSVKTAGTAAAALELLGREPFDVVVSDLGLPDATGYELMEQIRKHQSVKCIAMSGFGMEEDIQKSRQAGFSEHLVKPLKIEQLEMAIRRAMGKE